LKKSENTIAFFPILKDGAKHYKRYLGLNPPFDLIVHTGTAGTGSDILNTNHMFPNPAGPFTHLSTFAESELFQSMYGFLRGLYTGVFCTRCAWMTAPQNNTENHFIVVREKNKEHTTHEIEERKSHSIRCVLTESIL